MGWVVVDEEPEEEVEDDGVGEGCCARNDSSTIGG
jgi:hypothetical protein